MAEIIKFPAKKPAVWHGAYPPPAALLARMIQEQRERDNARWAEAVNKREKTVSIRRASFMVLGIAFAILHWWWAMGGAFVIMLLVNKLTKKVV